DTLRFWRFMQRQRHREYTVLVVRFGILRIYALGHRDPSLEHPVPYLAVPIPLFARALALAADHQLRTVERNLHVLRIHPWKVHAELEPPVLRVALHRRHPAVAGRR